MDYTFAMLIVAAVDAFTFRACQQAPFVATGRLGPQIINPPENV